MDWCLSEGKATEEGESGSLKGMVGFVGLADRIRIDIISSYVCSKAETEIEPKKAAVTKRGLQHYYYDTAVNV